MTARDVLSRPAPGPDLTVSYGPGPDHIGDVWLPAPVGGPAPLVVVLHGGFWQAEYDRTHLRPMAVALAGLGFAVCLPEYARVGQPGGGWPGTFDDVAKAMDTVPALVASAADGRVDASRMVLAGHSAGGHLALWSAGRHRIPAGSPWHRDSPLPVRGVVALAPAASLAQPEVFDVEDSVVYALAGGTHDEVPEHYALIDPTELLPSGVPTVVVQGRDDEQVPMAVSTDYVRAARAAGDPVELRLLDGVEHFGLIDPLSTAAWPVVVAEIKGMCADP